MYKRQPQWSQNVPIQKPVSSGEFHFAALIITVLAYLVAFLYLSFPKINLIKWAFTGFLSSMVINAIFPHLIATILLRTYAPGVITGLLLNLPINTIILYNLHTSKSVSTKEIFISTVVAGILLLALLPVLFTFGNRIIDY